MALCASSVGTPRRAWRPPRMLTATCGGAAVASEALVEEASQRGRALEHRGGGGRGGAGARDGLPGDRLHRQPQPERVVARQKVKERVTYAHVRSEIDRHTHGDDALLDLLLELGERVAERALAKEERDAAAVGRLLPVVLQLAQ